MEQSVPFRDYALTQQSLNLTVSPLLFVISLSASCSVDRVLPEDREAEGQWSAILNKQFVLNFVVQLAQG